jgi:Family of unknown function (DUF6502)
MFSPRSGSYIAGRRAVEDMLFPVALFAFDIGMDFRTIVNAIRTALVLAAVDRLVATKTRPTASSISVTTGLPRAVVSKILRTINAFAGVTSKLSETVANRILRNWHDDPAFLNSSGKPTELPIYGKGITFESLARKYARSVPVRALLDELLRANAVKLTPNRRLKARASIAVYSGLSRNAIESFRVRATDLMSTLLHNMHHPKSPRFVASALISSVPTTDLSVVRRQISDRAANLLADLDIFSDPSMPKRRRNAIDAHTEIKVTVYVSEKPQHTGDQKISVGRRRNMSRR